MSTPIKTLASARARIQELEAQLAGKPATSTNVAKPSAKPASKPLVSVRTAIDSSVSVLMSGIRSKLALESSSDRRMDILQSAIEQLREQRAKLDASDVKRQTEISRAIARCQKQSAYEAYGNKEKWGKRYWSAESR